MMEEEMEKCKGSSSIQTTHLSAYEHYFPDLISALPDSLLLDHILSLLNMEDVMVTSLLSRRWRYLWKSVSCLCFEPFRFFPRIELTNFIDRCLFHHKGSKIHKLHISFYYEDKHAPLVDSWIHFAITCKVEDFKLHFYGGGYLDKRIVYDELYKLPQCLYFCGTLTSLTLCMCNLILPHSFQLASLEKLSLQHLELNTGSIEHLSSSCPLLEDICLLNCNSYTDLNIIVTNQHVKRLEISEYTPYRSNTGRTVKINAPTLLSLRIYKCCQSVRFHVEELGSLMSADIISENAFSYFYENIYLDQPSGNYLVELLSDLRHVKHLKLCSRCIKALSLLRLQSLDVLSLSATCIVLHARLTKWELPGISYLLENCSKLEKLKIVNANFCDRVFEFSDEFIDIHDFEEEEYWESLETDLPQIMQNIKIIEINALGDSIDEEFVGFLLKNAKVLEKMTLSMKHLQRFYQVSIKSTWLELETSSTKCELPGIAYFLQSASNLEKLTNTLWHEKT